MAITTIIIGLTCMISIYALSNSEAFQSLCHYPYYEDKNNEKYRWLTSGFLHGDYFHLFINMFVLFNFGIIVEERFQEILGASAGKVMFFSFYLIMIVIANLPTFAKHKKNGGYRAVGASGATSAIVFSSIVFEPTSKIYLFAALPMPAIVFGVLYLVYEHWAGKRNMDNIGHDAHFYGAIAGFVFTILIKPSLFQEFLHKITTAF